MPTITEDSGAPTGSVGAMVSSLVDLASPAGQVDNVTDADMSPLLGIAVIGTAPGFTCFYTLDNGTAWIPFGSLSLSTARLLAANGTNRVYCQPSADFNGGVGSAITFYAWDQTSGVDGTADDASSRGGSTAFSVASDGAGITVTAVNDAPSATNLSAAETYTENTSLNLVDIVASDVDSTNITVTLTLSDPAVGTLSTGTSGAVTSTYVAGTGVWTASGFTADVNALLAGVTFTPVANGNANFTVTTSVSDGALSVSGSKSFTGIAVNDALQATNLDAAEQYTINTPLDLVNIVTSDDNSSTVTVNLYLPDSADLYGSFNTASSGIVTSIFFPGQGRWTASGPIADVNLLLAGLVWTPPTDFIDTFTLDTEVSDGTTTVTGGKVMSVLDTTPPETLITSHTANSIAASVATFEFSSTEQPSTFECRVDDGKYAVCTSPYITDVLAIGDHTFSVRARDAADNTDQTPATISWTISDSEVTSVVPADNTTGVSVDTQIVFTFSGPVPESIANNIHISVGPCGDVCPILNGVWSGNVLTYTKTGTPFDLATIYTVQLSADNGLQTDLIYSGQFTTASPVVAQTGGGIVPIEFLRSMSVSNPSIVKTVSLPVVPFVFTKTLKKGMDDKDVIELQKYLRSKGFEVTPVGQETTVFGSKTKKQLALFQKSVGIVPASGIFGSITMGYVNSHK